jgi:hypothetical protein
LKFEVKKRWTNEVAFTAEIEATDQTPYGEKLCMAVRWAIAAGIALTSLNLDDCIFTGSFEDSSFEDSSFERSSFVGSSFVRSRFERSSFVGSSFVRSRFVDSRFVRSRFEDSSFDINTQRQFKADLWLTLACNRNEVPALLDALRAGHIDGSVYEGECACLKGTIANIKHVSYTELSPNSSDPAECWFMGIQKGDTPETNLMSKLAVEWCEEWCALTGTPITALDLTFGVMS